MFQTTSRLVPGSFVPISELNLLYIESKIKSCWAKYPCLHHRERNNTEVPFTCSTKCPSETLSLCCHKMIKEKEKEKEKDNERDREGSKLSLKKGKLAKSKLAKSKSKSKFSTKVSLKEFVNQVDQLSTDDMPNVLPRRSTRIRGPPKSLSLGDFVGPWQGPSNVNKRGLRDVDSEDSSIECDSDLGTTQFRWTVEMQASPEQSPKQHQTPNAWNTPTRVLTDVEQWPKLTTVSPLVANEMMLSNKFGSLSADQRKEVMGSKQRESDKPVRACRNEDSVDLHMKDGSEGLDTLAISGKPLQVGSSLIKEEINKVSKLKYKIGAHKIENQVDGIYNVLIEISKKGFSHWDNALVGYFIDKRFSFHYVKTWAEKLWGNLLEDVVSIDNGFFIFKVKSEEAMDTILEDGPYYVGARLIVIKKWQPGLKLTKCEFSSVPLWVKLYNVPLELWSEEGLGYIASILGTPLYLDEPTFKRSRLTFARICIEVPANKEIPKSFKINLGYGDPYEIQVEVPWKPQRGRDGGQGSTPLINKVRETQSSIPSTSNAFDVLESCDMDELGNEDSSQELRNRGSPSPNDPKRERRRRRSCDSQGGQIAVVETRSLPFTADSSISVMEELMKNQMFATHAVAAAGSVTLGTALTYPLDTIKVLIQVGSVSNKQLTTAQVLDRVKTLSGHAGLYSGFGWLMLGRILGAGARFGTYEILTAFYKDGREDNYVHVSEAFMAGIAAGAVESVVSSPFELIKLRAQVNSASRIPSSDTVTARTAVSPLLARLLPGYSPDMRTLNHSVSLLSTLTSKHPNIIGGLKEYPWMMTGSGRPPSVCDVRRPLDIISLEGWGALWRDLRSGVVRDSIFGGIFFSSWQFLHRAMLDWKAVDMDPSPRSDEEIGPLSPLAVSLAAGFSGSVAAAASHCFDTAKSRSQCIVLPKYISMERRLLKWRLPGKRFERLTGIHPADRNILFRGIGLRMARSGIASFVIVGGYFLGINHLVSK
ncbi:unnamed protein product [Camellia sinensis]